MQYHKAGEVHWAYALVLCVTFVAGAWAAPTSSSFRLGWLVFGLVMLYASMRMLFRVDNSNPPSSHEPSHAHQALAEEHQAEWVTFGAAHPELSFEEHQTMATCLPSPLGVWTTKPR